MAEEKCFAQGSVFWRSQVDTPIDRGSYTLPFIRELKLWVNLFLFIEISLKVSLNRTRYKYNNNNN